ncbi:DUF4180 domain-containing protein [Paenibacillus arenilitoris]|uniref:DUF4180 domain-containing protein n=1 Tax=Paenibacillus arenilitoris TaxID=2772299 RepID=A0A927CHQ4_9BACL|nr:DUF4180 domain-containing protein [Paenibacillus arenilitoris]MBD2867252.1 DUF4180 domain-containing protein [Paenibacillus arenilitoris]
MNLSIEERNGVKIAVASGSETVIADVQSALDLIATAWHVKESDRIVMPKSLISEKFFDLKTGLAGEILQKFINYNVKLAVVGDFSAYASESMQAFIFECNKGASFLFVPTEEHAIEKLSLLK